MRDGAFVVTYFIFVAANLLKIAHDKLWKCFFEISGSDSRLWICVQSPQFTFSNWLVKKKRKEKKDLNNSTGSQCEKQRSEAINDVWGTNVRWRGLCAKGVGCSGVTGFVKRAENRRSAAVDISHHQVQTHIQLHTWTRQQVRFSILSGFMRKIGEWGKKKDFKHLIM